MSLIFRKKKSARSPYIIGINYNLSGIKYTELHTYLSTIICFKIDKYKLQCKRIMFFFLSSRCFLFCTAVWRKKKT